MTFSVKKNDILRVIPHSEGLSNNILLLIYYEFLNAIMLAP